jgi:hypothetical protein
MGLNHHITLHTDYLGEVDILVRLASADMVVYPYQATQESASAAVRLGLASLTPVACTPLPIFRDVAAITHRLPGTGPADLAAGIKALLANETDLFRFSDVQRAWVSAHSWPVISDRLDGLIRGEFVDGLLASPEGENFRCVTTTQSAMGTCSAGLATVMSAGIETRL